MSKPVYEMPAENSPRGNIFIILGEVQKILKDHGLEKDAETMLWRITQNHEAKSYDEAKNIIGEYVDVI